MNKCKNCKDWIELEHKTTEGVIIGECCSKKLKRYYHDTLKDGITVQACGHEVAVMTGVDFSCINYRKRIIKA